MKSKVTRHRSQIAAINRKKTQRILWYESIGFILLMVLSWLNELISLPHLLFGSGEHSNLHEAIMETSVLLLVWAVVFLFTRRLLARLYFLDNFLRVCAWCQKIGHDDQWSSLEDYFHKGFAITTSHSMCPECQQKWEQVTPNIAA